MSLLISLGLIHQLMNVYCLPEGSCLAGLALCLDPVCLDEGKVEGLTLEFGVCWAGGNLGYVGSREASGASEVRLRKRR